MLLFTENALKETERLHSAGYQVSIREDMNARWIEAIGKIDGAMLLDQYGKLYMETSGACPRQKSINFIKVL